MYTLIIAEKPSAAQKIAESLADKKPIKHGERNVVWFEFERDKTPVFIETERKRLDLSKV